MGSRNMGGIRINFYLQKSSTNRRVSEAAAAPVKRTNSRDVCQTENARAVDCYHQTHFNSIIRRSVREDPGTRGTADAVHDDDDDDGTFVTRNVSFNRNSV